MSARPQSSVRNRLLGAMSATDFAAIEPHLQLIPALAGTVLVASNATIEFLYFPERGFTSITIGAQGNQVEVGMIGREGLVGASPTLLGVDSTPHQAFIQMPGQNLRIATSDLRHVLAHNPTMHGLLLRYIHCIMIQMAQTAYANAVCDIESRLARWILMCHDRADGQDINITHEFLSMMLGVRRAGVTLAVQTLEGNGFIKATRGHIRMLDRHGLIAAAQDSYGEPEAEYALLIERQSTLKDLQDRVKAGDDAQKLIVPLADAV